MQKIAAGAGSASGKSNVAAEGVVLAAPQPEAVGTSPPTPANTQVADGESGSQLIGSVMTTNPARRKMNEYLLYDSDIALIGKARESAFAFQALAAGAIGFLVNLGVSMLFVDWGTIQGFTIGIIVALVGVSTCALIYAKRKYDLALAEGKTEIARIKEENGHVKRENSA